MLDKDAIRELLDEHIDRHGRARGMTVGVVSPEGSRIIAHGVRGAKDPAAVEADTLFEIGSATKVITALLLAEAIQRGELALDDAAQDRLPAGVRLPEQGGRRITLRDLATHTSGLPMFPPGSPPFGHSDWARYGASDLFEAVSGYVLPRGIGEAWAYSNTGYGLLGHVLSHAAGVDYESLARERVLEPLAMTSTAIALDPALEARTATPHGADLAPADRLQLPGLEAAGAFWSSAADMLTFLAAALGLVETPLAGAFAAMLEVDPVANPLGAEQALGWWLWPTPTGRLLNHDGGTGGFAASLFCDPRARQGVVVLSNSVAPVGQLARRILRPDEAAPVAATRRAGEIVLTDAELSGLVGVYQSASGAEIVIEREADGLALQAPNAPRLALSATSRTEFAAAVAALTATFSLGPGGRAIGVAIDFAGRRTESRRIA